MWTVQPVSIFGILWNRGQMALYLEAILHSEDSCLSPGFIKDRLFLLGPCCFQLVLATRAQHSYLYAAIFKQKLLILLNPGIFLNKWETGKRLSFSTEA